MVMFLDLPKVPLPGPRTMPVLGGKISLMRFLGDPVKNMLDLREEFGEFVALSKDDPGWVCAFGSEFNREILSNPGLYPNFIESPIRKPADSAAATLDYNILVINGDLHRSKRRVLMAAFTKARLQAYGEQMVEIAGRQIGRWRVPGAFRAREAMTDISLEIAMRCLFGLGLEESRALCTDSARIMDLVLSPAAALFPFSLPGTPYREYMTCSERVDGAFRRLIAARRAEPKEDDVLSAMIHATDDDGEHMTDRELVGQAATLFNASHDTSAMTLTWACLMLATHPEIQREAAEEVKEAIGDAPPTLEDIERMPKLGWIIQETLRLFPATPNLFFRRSSADSELGGRKLPAGATFILSPLVTHRDPKVFPNPRRFDPKRWDGLRLGPYDYIPFGAGVRRCVGAGFAGQSTRLILATFLQNARIAAPRPQRIDYRAKGVVLGLERDFDLELLSPDQDIPAPKPIGGTVERLVEFRA